MTNGNRIARDGSAGQSYRTFMTEYLRAPIPGATWSFSANLAERKGSRLLVEEVAALRNAFRSSEKKGISPIIEIWEGLGVTSGHASRSANCSRRSILLCAQSWERAWQIFEYDRDYEALVKLSHYA